mmetsp:Transcript_32623/g.79367  ORF Transcript_32623/g.79367 Transcript_32623/m.79367 type:complete len:714 (+) Transcript_32623:219-2360(+)
MASMLSWVKGQVAHAQEAVKRAVPITQEEIPINGSRVRIIKQLGQGGYAFVYLVEDINSGRQYALKKMLAGDAEAKEVAKMEVRIMKSYKKSPNLVRYFDSCMKASQNRRMTEYYILMEFCPRGSLLDEITERIERDNYYSERQIARMFKQVCTGVKWFHTRSPPIQHRDLKIENLLIAADGSLRLCDFGSCTLRSKKYTTRAEILQEEERIQKYTTNCYMAPEMADLYKQEVISEKVDIWALGCILFVLAFFEHPFQDKGALAIINGSYQIPTKNKYSSVLLDMIKGLLVAKPKKRPDIHKALAMVNMWEKYLETGKRPDFKQLGKKQDDGESEDSDSDDSEKERRKKLRKKKKKLEKKRRKEAEKKAKEDQKRAMQAAAARRARRQAQKEGKLQSPQLEDDFPVDWGSATKSPANDAGFDVDWDDDGDTKTGLDSKKESAPVQQKSGGGWDPFADNAPSGGGGGDIFSILEDSSSPKPAAPATQQNQFRGTGMNAAHSRAPSNTRPPLLVNTRPALPRQPSGMSHGSSSSHIGLDSPSDDIMAKFDQPAPQVMGAYGQMGMRPMSSPTSPGPGRQWGMPPNNGYMVHQQQMMYQQQQMGAYMHQRNTSMGMQQQNGSARAMHHQIPRQRTPQAYYPPTQVQQAPVNQGLSSAFSGVSLGGSQQSSQNQATFEDDPFANVGIANHTPEPKSEKKKQEKKKDVFDSLGEFSGF